MMNVDELRTIVAQHYDTFGREVRTMSDDTTVRADDDESTLGLVGHAAVFNVITTIGTWFREQVEVGAFKKTIKEADVRHLFNHDPNIVLARTKNDTLLLKEDKIGLAFDADLNADDPDAIRVAAKVARGDVDQSSFAFRVVKDMWEESDDPGILPLRTLLEVKLFDTSTVTYPAYESADTALRAVGLDVLTEALSISDEERMALMFSLASGKLTPELAPTLERARAALGDLIEECRGAACDAPDGGGRSAGRTPLGEDSEGIIIMVTPDEPGNTHSDEDVARILVRHAFREREMAQRANDKE